MTCSRLLGSGLLLLALAGSGSSQETDQMWRSPELSHGPRAPVEIAGFLASGYYGEHIIHVGDGGNEALRLYGIRNVGFKFTVVSLACFHLWTWGGTYCVYEPVFEDNRLNDKYKPISRAEAARLLGKPESELTAPFWYRFPPGYMLLLTGLSVGVIAALARWIKKRRPPVNPVESGV